MASATVKAIMKPAPTLAYLPMPPGVANVLDAVNDPRLFGPWFSNPSWDGWKVILAAMEGLPLDRKQRRFFASVAGERKPPKRRVRELFCIAGRGAAKSRMSGLLAAFEAIFFVPSALSPGQRVTVMCLAVDRAQAAIVLDFIRTVFDHSLMARRLITRQTADTLELSNGVDVVVATNSFRSVRGRSILMAILDEAAFFRDDSTASPDVELYRALGPGLMRVAGSRLVVISSPYRKSGLLWNKYREFFAKDDDDTLVIQAATEVLNPVADKKLIAKAYADDAASARAEYGALFRDDLAQFVDPEIVQACVFAGVHERLPVKGVNYIGFLDPSGGSADSYTCSVAHCEGEIVIVDAVREIRPPFDPDRATEELAGLLKSYGCSAVYSDRYGGMWPSSRMMANGISVQPCEQNKSALYLELLPWLNSRRVALLDNKRLVSQLCSLNRETSRLGKDSVDHPKGQHDDVANAVAGAVVMAIERPGIKVSEQTLARLRAMGPRGAGQYSRFSQSRRMFG